MNNNTEKKDKNKPFQDIEFKSLKLVFKSILIILFIVLSLMLIFSIKSVAITQDINYTFEVNKPYDNYDDTTMNTYNLRHSNTITQNYSATYDFLDDDIGGTPQNWSIDETGGHINISEVYNGHNKIIKMYDNNDGGMTILNNEHIINRVSGTIELWLSISDTSKSLYFQLKDGNTDNAIFLFILADKLKYVNGGTNDITDLISNVWYHIRIDFECGIGNYLGLAPNTFYVYINDVKYGAYSMKGNPIEMDICEFNTGTIDSYYNVYIDAIGYSWDINYTIESNVIPDIIIENQTRLKPDRYEFTMDTNGYRFADNVQNPTLEGWNNEYGQNVYTDNIAMELEDNVDYWEYGLRTHGSLSLGSGISNNTIKLYDDQINITFGLRYFDISNFNSKINLWIKSLDGSTLMLFKVDTINSNKARLQYLDENEAYQDIIDIYGINDPLSLYEFNLFIDDFDVNLLYYVNNTYNSSHSFPLKENLKGMSYVSLTAYDDNTDDFTVRFEYCGLYQYNISLCNEFGYLSYNLTDYYNLKHHNLLTVNCSDYAIIYVSNVMYQWDRPIDDWDIPLRSMNNTDFFNNTIAWSENIPYNFEPIGYLHLITNSSGIDYSNIYFNIEGVKLVDGSNSYPLIFNSVNVNIKKNYFYVKNNKLYFYIDLNENNYEGIEATFNIPNISSTNSTFSFKGKYSGMLPSYMIIDYVNYESSYMEMKDYITSNRYLLPQRKIIDKLIINVSDYIPFQDNYTFHNEGYISGYISDISFNFLPDIEYTITTMTLISGFIPLIVIFTPTFALFSRFGKKIILPSMIFMTIICFVAQLIPLWLFSISMLVYGYLIIVDKYESD